jgi:hypothetical protein
MALIDGRQHLPPSAQERQSEDSLTQIFSDAPRILRTGPLLPNRTVDRILLRPASASLARRS